MHVGLYGKLPSHGDFLRRRASDALVEIWDAWLQECIAASRSALGARWLDVYLTSPIWRFACAPGVCGPEPVIGLMAPSVDRVGRYFPLTLVAELPPHSSVLRAATQTSAFFQSAERLVIETLEAEHVDFEDFDARVSKLVEELSPVALPLPVAIEPAAAGILGKTTDTRWQMPIGSAAQLAPLFEQMTSHRLAMLYEPLVLWWTEGSSNVEPTCLIVKGLPHPNTFAAFLDGSWAQHSWQAVPVRVEGEPLFAAARIQSDSTVRYRSSAKTDVGLARTKNQDAFLERSEVGLWVVADGLGGHVDGDIASRMVCDALSDFDPGANLDEFVAGVRERLREVNDYLLRTAARSLLGDRSGSTVVVLLVRGTNCSVVWAGDSRVYRWREGRLEQLTRDHSASTAPIGRSDSNIITRAVGVASMLELDVYRDTVRTGDRFLLCSDGLTRTVSDFQIQSWLEKKDIDAAVTGLIGASLELGAPDNVTALIVEAYAGEDNG